MLTAVTNFFFSGLKKRNHQVNETSVEPVSEAFYVLVCACPRRHVL
jgi:hypothetical protein